MPHGLPDKFPFTRSEWALDYLTNDPLEIAAGTMITVKYPLADQDGWNGEWLCEADGKQLAIQPHTLTFHAPT